MFNYGKGVVHMENRSIANKLNDVNRIKKEQFLKYLLTLEMQERSGNQGPVSAFHQKGD